MCRQKDCAVFSFKMKGEVPFSIQKRPFFGFLAFVTLKILFIDLTIQLGDLGSDLAQGYFLLINEELFIYGVCTFAIHWVPGVVASIHCISTKRAEYGVKKTLKWAGENTYIAKY